MIVDYRWLKRSESLHRIRREQILSIEVDCDNKSLHFDRND